MKHADAATNVRLVSVQPEAPWLGNASRGFAVETIAPERVFGLATGDQPYIRVRTKSLPQAPSGQVYSVWLVVDPSKRQAYPVAPLTQTDQQFPIPARQQAVERLNQTLGRTIGRGFIPGL